MENKKGQVTLPIESDFYNELKELSEKWGADAIRDSDGTSLDKKLCELGLKIYHTYFVARGHNEFAKKHLDECQQVFLMSHYELAKDKIIKVNIMQEYYDKQIKPDYYHNPKKYWQVFDRTTNQEVSLDKWEYHQEDNSVTIKDCELFHEYTVNFLAYLLWDPTQMYNYITNDWCDVERDIPFDVRKPNSNKYVKDCLEKWLDEHDNECDVVRFTTFFYHFTLIFNQEAKEKFVDWCGYGLSVSVEALESFEKTYGYTLCSEDFIQNGYYNSSFCNPSKQYLDFINFQQQFVSQEAKLLVDIVHHHQKEAMMFLGDNWIGTEPYGQYFKNIGLDAVVGSVGNGATLRLIADIEGVKYREGRFLPYFFPDTFYEGNDPCIEAKQNWLCARRALMRKPLDRIGYGGYPSLAYKFDNFVDYISKVCDEYRDIYSKINHQPPLAKVTVAILNAWGSLRSWHAYMVAHGLYSKQIYSYNGILEALSGMDVNVKFISFDDVINHGIDKDIDVIINAGMRDTAFSGREYWDNPKLVSEIRKFVYHGHGFIGVGEPCAYEKGGHFFQLSDVLGVDKELSFTLHSDKYFKTKVSKHFITDDYFDDIDYGEKVHDVYAISKDTEIIDFDNDEVYLSSHDYGKGRGIYLAGLPYSCKNTRLLKRAIFYACHKEDEFYDGFVDNINCEMNIYPTINQYAILNNSDQVQTTSIYFDNNKVDTITLDSGEIRWMVKNYE